MHCKSGSGELPATERFGRLLKIHDIAGHSFEGNNNKTAGQHRHIFRCPILLKMPFKRMKSFFSKNTFSSCFFLSNFSNFFAKNFTINVGKTFRRNSIIWCVFCSKLATFTDFEKNHIFFQTYVKTNYVRIWEIFQF